MKKKSLSFSDLKWWKKKAIPFIRTMQVIAGVSLLLCIALFIFFPDFYPVWVVVGAIAIYYMVILPLGIKIFFFRGSEYTRNMVKFFIENY